MVDARGEASVNARVIGGEWFGRSRRMEAMGRAVAGYLKGVQAWSRGKKPETGCDLGAPGRRIEPCAARFGAAAWAPVFVCIFSFEPSGNPFFGSFCEVCPAVLHRLYFFFCFQL
jgi:hypothetical protein